MSPHAPPIALFANHDSPQIQALAPLIEECGGQPLVFDIQLGGPSVPRFVIDDQRCLWDGVDLSGVRAIHIRCTSPNTLPTVPALTNARGYAQWSVDYLKEQEYQAAVYSFFEELAARGSLVVNRLTKGYPDHSTKAQLYHWLRTNGFRAPRTLTTTDPNALLQFRAEVGRLVVKPAIGVGSTREVQAADLERLAEVSRCPVMLQELIEGATIRVHVVGNSMVAAVRVYSDSIDSRTAPERFEEWPMPPDEQERIVRATRGLGLYYAAWDMIVNDRGEHVYLDCNPGPYVLWVGEPYRSRVLRELARFLVGFARNDGGCE